MAVNEQLSEGLKADAEKLMKAWKQWHDASESHVATPQYWQSLKDVRENLQARQLLAISLNPQIGEMVLRRESHGGPILLIHGGEIVFSESAFELAWHCKGWYASMYGYLRPYIKIMRVVG